MNLILLKDYLMALVGTPYKYGGSNPLSGLDCSGLGSEILEAMGITKHGVRLSAQQIHDFLKDRGDEGHFGIGSFAFYGKSLSLVDHVAICLDNYLMIEAGGGDHTTTTLSEAIGRGAFVRMRPIQYRRDFLCVISPIYQFVTAPEEDPGAH